MKMMIGSDDIFELLDERYWKDMPPSPKPHGEVVERKMMPFHDVVVYEDGHEEWFYIGD